MNLNETPLFRVETSRSTEKHYKAQLEQNEPQLFRALTTRSTEKHKKAQLKQNEQHEL